MPHTPVTDRFLPAVGSLMRSAGEIILSAHDPESPGHLHSKPGTQNFVTDYDIAVQRFLIDGLTAAFPGAGFIGEEKANDASLLGGELCFVIDPIDGTNNFIHNCRMSCSSVATVSRGEVIFGAVYNPYSGKLVHAAKREGCFEDSRPVRVSDRPMRIAMAVFGPCPYYKDTLSEATFSMAREVFCACADIHRTGSAAIDLCSVATGSCDLFFELILQPWDYAAGKLIVEEAGGIITAADGSPLTLDRPSSVICGTPETYPALLEIAKKYI